MSEDIIESLTECYEEDSVFSKIMPMQIPENSGNYLIASIDGNPTAVFFQITEDYFQQYFSYQSAVNLDYEKIN